MPGVPYIRGQSVQTDPFALRHGGLSGAILQKWIRLCNAGKKPLVYLYFFVSAGLSFLLPKGARGQGQ